MDNSVEDFHKAFYSIYRYSDHLNLNSLKMNEILNLFIYRISLVKDHKIKLIIAEEIRKQANIYLIKNQNKHFKILMEKFISVLNKNIIVS